MGVLASILPIVTAALGVAVVVLLGVLIVLIVMILRRERPEWEKSDNEIAREAAPLRSIPNSKAHWRPSPEPEWSNPESATILRDQLLSMGFQTVGNFVHSGRGSTICLFAIANHSAAAWIEENAEGGIDLTVSSWSAEGAPIRVSNVKSESSFVLLHGERRQISGSRSPVDLCRELAALREGLSLLPVTLENALAHLNREERLRARRLTQDEGTADLWGRHLLKTEVRDEETGDRISGRVLRSVFLRQLGESINDCCLESFAESSQISAADWARLHDRFLVIHDRLATPDLKNLEICEELSRDERKRIKPFFKKELPAREAFKGLNAELPPHLQFVEVGRVSDPVEATVYLAS